MAKERAQAIVKKEKVQPIARKDSFQTVQENRIIISDTTANPAPLGLLGFGLTTVLLNIHNAGFAPMGASILAMGIFYGA